MVFNYLKYRNNSILKSQVTDTGLSGFRCGSGVLSAAGLALERAEQCIQYMYKDFLEDNQKYNSETFTLVDCSLALGLATSPCKNAGDVRATSMNVGAGFLCAPWKAGP